MKKSIYLALTLILAMSLFSSCGSKLTDDEKYVLDCIEKYQDETGISVNDLYDGVTVINAVISDDNVRYAVIPYGGTKDGGVVHTASPVFVDGVYYMDADEYVPVDGSDESLDKELVRRNVNPTFASAAGWDVIDINEEIILEQLNK